MIVLSSRLHHLYSTVCNLPYNLLCSLPYSLPYSLPCGLLCSLPRSISYSSLCNSQCSLLDKIRRSWDGEGNGRQSNEFEKEEMRRNNENDKMRMTRCRRLPLTKNRLILQKWLHQPRCRLSILNTNYNTLFRALRANLLRNWIENKTLSKTLHYMILHSGHYKIFAQKHQIQ